MGGYLTRKSYKEDMLDEAGDVDYDDGVEEGQMSDKEKEMQRKRLAERRKKMKEKRAMKKKGGYMME